MNDIIPEKNLPRQKMERESNSKLGKTSKRDTRKVVAILCLIVVVISIALIFGAIKTGTKAVNDSFDDTFNSEKEAVYQKIYEKYFTQAEEKYHVSNRVSISVEDLKETAKLEVLTVTDTEYIIEDSETNDDGYVSWLEVPGQGTYVIDLQSAEFVVDNERQSVLVIIPYPELTNVSIDYTNVKKLLFENENLISNGNYSKGEDKARSQVDSALSLIQKEFASNQYYYETAQNAAITTVQCLVKQLTPEIENLTVDVEFFSLTDTAT